MKVFNGPGRRIELPEHSAPILYARKRSDPLESQPQAMPIYKHLPVPYDAEYSTLAGYKAGHESVYRNIPMHYDPDPDFRYATRHWKNLLLWVSVIQVVRRLGGGLVEPQPGRNKKKTGVQRSATWSPIETSLRGIKSWEVPGTINGVPVNALPDWGSSVDAVSEGFARQLGLQIQVANPQSITLIGGHTAESLGRAIGYFRFRGNGHTYRREFHVLRKSVYDVVLGRKFLDQTRTFTKFSHRIVERFRPCIQGGDRLFLMDESPNDRIRCAVNGSEASAFPDTGSELMLISGNFVRRNRFNVHREEKYRRPVELIDGSTVYTDGMVLNAELQFDAPPASSQELNLDRYVEFVTNISSCRSTGVKTTEKATFICDLHVIEDLPCDIILSNEFIFENQVFSRFKNLFYSEPGDTSSRGCKPLDNCLLFVRLKRSRFSWLRQWVPQPRGYNNTSKSSKENLKTY